MMNSKVLLKVALIIGMLALIQCDKDQHEDFGDMVWTELNDQYFDYLGIAKTEELIAIKSNSSGSLPELIYYKNGNNKDFVLWLDNDGYPNQAYINGFYIIYSNIRDSYVDVGIVNNKGETEIIYDINYDFTELISLINSNTLKSGRVNWGNVIKWSGHALNAGMCVASLTGAAASFGILAPVAALTCVSLAVGIASELAAVLVDNENFDNALLSLSGQGGFASIGDVMVLTGNFINYVENDRTENYNSIEEIKQRLDNKDVGIKFGNFGLTELRYDDDSNWAEIVQNIFGSNYRIADWNDLKEYYNDGGDLIALYDGLGLTEYGNSAYLTRNGVRAYSSTRYYFATRHEYNKPSSYLAHENINNYLISLGSWYGSNPIMVRRNN